jgi:chromosomal replication initiation ATPase DnaA
MDNILKKATDLMETRSRIIKAIEAACLVCNISRKEFESKKRQRHLVDCRRMVITFCRDNLELTWVHIARQFKLNHASIMYNHKVHTQLIQSDKFYLQKYNKFEDLVKADISFVDIENIIYEIALKRKNLQNTIKTNEENTSQEK